MLMLAFCHLGSLPTWLNLNLTSIFFTPIPRSYTSLPIDGVARNYYSFLFLSTWKCKKHAIYRVWIHLFLPPMSEERRKSHWSELESNPGHLASIIHKRPLWPLDHASSGNLTNITTDSTKCSGPRCCHMCLSCSTRFAKLSTVSISRVSSVLH